MGLPFVLHNASCGGWSQRVKWGDIGRVIRLGVGLTDWVRCGAKLWREGEEQWVNIPLGEVGLTDFSFCATTSLHAWCYQQN